MAARTAASLGAALGVRPPQLLQALALREATRVHVEYLPSSTPGDPCFELNVPTGSKAIEPVEATPRGGGSARRVKRASRDISTATFAVLGGQRYGDGPMDLEA
ncbi:hypothetical protein ACCO45_003218 [Purpureocillium lilacinum]|uniref:Uncharacterized protein n=1 Tax=Purpureocillium lilacinum TaxID=33203 RepID=A0ACC4DZ75_PURLI